MPYISDKRLYATNDGKIVPEDHPDAATLVVGAGGMISDDQAEQYGLVKPKKVEAEPVSGPHDSTLTPTAGFPTTGNLPDSTVMEEGGLQAEGVDQNPASFDIAEAEGKTAADVNSQDSAAVPNVADTASEAAAQEEAADRKAQAKAGAKKSK